MEENKEILQEVAKNETDGGGHARDAPGPAPPKDAPDRGGAVLRGALRVRLAGRPPGPDPEFVTTGKEVLDR